MKPVSDTAPIDFQSLPENEQKEVDRVVGKIVAGCTIKTGGKDLLRGVYLSGLYHGVTISKMLKAGTDWIERNASKTDQFEAHKEAAHGNTRQKT